MWDCTDTDDPSLTNAVLLVGHRVIAAPLPEMVSVGSSMHHREGRRYVVHSDKLLSAFLESETTLL